MPNLLGIADLVVIGFMLVVSASIGLYFRFTGGRQKTMQEFLMAGKDMQVGPVAFSLMATYMSAITVLGIPVETYLFGTQLVTSIAGMPIGALISAYGFLPVFFDMNVSTAYEYLERRFGKLIRTATSFLFTVQTVLYMAVVLYAPSLALNAVTGLSTWTSVFLLSIVCAFYCSLGGLKAVLWTDVFQSLLMYVTIFCVFVAVVWKMGFSKVFDIAEDGGRLIFLNVSTDLTERYTLWNTFLFSIVFGTYTYGSSQAQIQRIMSMGSLKRAQMAVFWSVPLIVIYNVVTLADGVVLYAMFHDCDPMKDPDTKLGSSDQLMPFAIMKLFGGSPGLAGLCIAGVFSAALSTISSAVNSLTAVTLEDYIRPYCSCNCLTESRAAVLAKLLGVVFCIITLLLTYLASNFRGIVEAGIIVFGLVAGPILGTFILGMFSRTANEKGTFIGLLTGCTLSAWLGFGSYAAKPPVLHLSQSIDGCASVLNATVNNAGESLMNTDVSALLDPVADERYIFPLYTISFLWFTVIGCLGVVIVGYVSSFLIGLCLDIPDVDPQALSPFVRNYLTNPSETMKNKNVKENNLKMELNSVK